MKTSVYVVIIAILLTACNSNQKGNKSIDIHWKLVNNLANEKGESEWLITLTNSSDIDLPPVGWTLYYNVIQMQHTPQNSGFLVEHANGDLRCIKPTSEFKGLSKGKSIQIHLFSNGSVLNNSDRPLGFYLVFDENPDKAYECNTTYSELPVKGLARSNNDNLPVHSPEITFNENKAITRLNKDDICPIVPTPLTYQKQDGQLILKDNLTINSDFTNTAAFLTNKLSNYFNGSISLGKTNPQIKISKSNEIKNPEGYELTISEQDISIKASTEKGAFYAVQSLLQLIPNAAYAEAKDELILNATIIKDEPRFAYRGQFLDVARNFHSKEQVLKLLDLMAFYKLNKFHFHICDDEGWRVEIKGLPELTEFGSFRGYSVNESKYLQPSFGCGPHPKSQGSGFYTHNDFIEILTYATERHIEVLPEIDMPGHARAAIKSMEKRYEKFIQLGDTTKATEYLLTDFNDQSKYQSVQGWNDNVINVGMESTYNFLAKVTDELLAMYDEAGIQLTTIHTGGDEVPHGVWEQSPECDKIIDAYQEYQTGKDLSLFFIKRFSGLLAERNLTAAGWEEIALLHGDKLKPNPYFVGKNLMPFVWNNVWGWGSEDIGYQLANAGYPVVLAHVTNFYFDLAYHKHPEEFGYYWGSFINTRKPWEYTPFDIVKCAKSDHFGNPVDIKRFDADMEKLSPKGRENILGIQGLLWSETSTSPERNDYQIFPKLLGLAERAWSPQPGWAKNSNKALREKDWNTFVNTVGQYQLPKLDYFHGGTNYRIPAPGAMLIDGMLHANIRFPGLELRYTTDGSEPTKLSKIYTEPILVDETIMIRAFNLDGRSGRVIEIKN